MQVDAHDYDRMRAWLAHVARQVLPAGLITPETNPVAVLDRLAAASVAKARSGLAMAVSDLVEMTTGWPDDQVEAMDRDLRDEGLPSLSEVRAQFSKAVHRAVRRGRIKDDTEYYTVRNAAELGGQSQEQLCALLAAYEERVEG